MSEETSGKDKALEPALRSHLSLHSLQSTGITTNNNPEMNCRNDKPFSFLIIISLTVTSCPFLRHSFHG